MEKVVNLPLLRAGSGRESMNGNTILLPSVQSPRENSESVNETI